MGQALGTEVVENMDVICKWAKYDPSINGSFCRKYGHDCEVACMSCRDNS